MEFSKDRVVSKSFSKKVWGGLNEFEVRDFLHVLAEQIDLLERENQSLKKDLNEKEELVQDYKNREHILKESISNAENWAEKIKQSAEKHRELVLEKAQNDSESLIQSARQSLQTVYNDIADLKRLQIQFKTGLKAALQVQMDLLEDESILNPSLSYFNSEKTPANKNLNSAKEPGLIKQEPQENKPSEMVSKEESFSRKEDLAPEVGQELADLKESLDSLNKTFS